MNQMTPALASAIRKIILQQSMRAHVGHIGSALSIVEILTALYFRVMNVPDPGHPQRDRFILSKGHAALALYAVLYRKGWIDESLLNSFCGDGSSVGVHPEHQLTGVDFTTGSLGQGITFGVGTALAARLDGSVRRTFVVVSDGECNEGCLWEAVMFAAHQRLANLTVIVDLNGQQAIGHTRDVLDMTPMAARWRSFGWDAHEVDGHDLDAISAVLAGLDYSGGPPHVLIARTVFGKGVSYMENKIKWHYWPMSEEEYRQALQEVGASS